MTIAVDFETYFDGKYSVADLGNWAYCQNPKFNAYMVAFSGPGLTWVGSPEAAPWESMNGQEWVSHNREFDRSVFERCQELGKIPRHIRPLAWHCSAAAAASLQLPRDLAGASKAVLGLELDKSIRTRMAGKVFGSQSLFEGDVQEYARKDADTCLALWQKLAPYWPAQERVLFELTAQMGRAGVFIDQAYLKDCRTRLLELIEDCDRAIPFSPSTSIKAFRARCDMDGLEYPTSTAEDDFRFQRWLEKNSRSDAAMWCRLMQRRRSANRTLQVLESIRQRINSDGRLVYELKYFGGITGRWSGGGGLNLQNLPRGEIQGVDLRRCLMAKPGHVFITADFAQIESRVILYLAGDWDTLNLLRSGIDLYEAHARATMGYSNPAPLKEINPGLRQLAKARVLGLGFGCGAEKFIEVAKIMAGIEISFETAQEVVADFRRSNPKICGLWKRLERKFFEHAGNTYRLPLPITIFEPAARRYLIYRQIEEDGACLQGGRKVWTYGGKIAENWTQAAARDILAEAWINCVEEGYPPVLSVHDELVFEVPSHLAEQAQADITRIMEQPISWAPTLPMKVEARITNHYCK